jgi:hypothetical protein
MEGTEGASVCHIGLVHGQTCSTCSVSSLSGPDLNIVA